MAGAVQVGALVINMAADVASLKTSLAEANRAAKTSAEKMAGDFGAIRTSIESAVAPLKTLTVNVGSLESNMAKAQSSALALGKGLLLGAAAGMSIDAITRKISGVIETMAHLKEVSEKTGSSVENLSKLGFIAKQSGSDIDSVANALGKMSKGMAGADNDTKGAGLALKFLGISAKDTAGDLKDPAAMFMEVAKKLDGYRDGAGKAAIAQALFGKAGAEMLPTLKLLAEQGDMVAKTTTAQSAAALQYERDLGKLDTQKNTLFKTIATALLPTMSDFSGVLLDASKNANLVNGSVKHLAEDKSIEEWADDSAMALALLIDTFKLLPALFSTTVSGFKAIASLGNVALRGSPLAMAVGKINGGQPAEDLKAALADRLQTQEEFTKKLDALLAREVDGTRRAMQAKIDVRTKAKAAAASDTTEDSAMATPWDRPKEALNFNTGGEDGPTKAAGIDKEANAYATLISAIRAKTAANQLELATADAGTPSQIERIKLDQEIASGKMKLTDQHKRAAYAALDEQAATESLVKAQKTEKQVTELILQSAAARNEAKDELASEYALYGKSNDVREIALVAIKSEAQMQKELAAVRKADGVVTDDIITQLKNERDIRTDVGQATLEQKKALGYASQLHDENKKFAAESIFDEKQRAAAILQIDADLWQQRIQLAGEGTDAQKLLQGEYLTWYQNQLLKPQLDADKAMWGSIESTAHDTFISIFDSGKSAFNRLRDTLKNGLLDLLYQMTIKKWILNIGASVGMTGAGGVAQAANAAGGVGNGLSAMSGMSGALNFGGSAIAGVGNFVGSSSLSAFGAGFAGNSAGMVTTAAETFASAGMAVESSAASLGATFAAAMPYLAAAVAVYAVWKSMDTSGTYHTGGASSASAAGATTIRAESLNFEATRTNSETEKMTAALASGIVNILDSTATAFGKTAGYTAATAFADDTSKDGAWGGLVISKLGDKILDWQDTKTGSWAPKVFADGEAGKAEYLAALSTSVRTALDGIGLPTWAQGMLDKVGAGASIEDLGKVVDSINATERALVAMSSKLTGFASLSEGAVSALIAASGGIDALATSASAYYDNFYSDAEKTAGSVKIVSDALAAVGVSMPASREAYRAQVEAQMALGESAAPTVAVLLKNSAAFAQLNPVLDAVAASTQSATDALAAAASIAKEQHDLDIQLMTAMGDAEGALAATRKDSLDAMLSDQARLTQAQIWSAEAASAAIAKAQETAAAQQAANAAATQSFGNALVGAMNGATAAAKALRAFNDSLLLGNLSPLSKGAQYDLAKQSFMTNGDQASATAFLQASQAKGGSKLDYARDFAMVIAGNSASAAAKDASAAAIPAIWAAFRSTQADGSHANGLAYVPFDGYRAVLHKGERVLTASEARNNESAKLENEISRMRSDLNGALQLIVRHTKDSATILRSVTRDGQSLITRPA